MRDQVKRLTTALRALLHRPRSSLHGRAVRVGKWALLAVVAMELLYLVAANTLLRTRILRNLIDDDRESLDLEYGSAWSLLPGVVHVEDLSIRGRGDSIEWWLHIDHAEFRVGLFDLCRKRFHTSYTTVETLDLRIRLRLRAEELSPDVVAALPDITGFSNPPLRDPPEAKEVAEPVSWVLDLERVDVRHARDVWIHSMRYVGETRVHGRWTMVPNRRLEVGPAHLELSSLTASYGSAPIGTGLSGAFDVTIDDVPIDGDDPSPAIFRALSLYGAVDGEGHTSAGLSRLIGVPGLTLISGRGPTHVEAHLVHGVFGAHTTVAAELAGVDVRAGREELSFAAKVSANLERTDIGLVHPRGSLSETEVALTDVALAHAELGAIARVSHAEFRTGSLTLASDEGARGVLDVRAPSVVLADASRFRSLLGSGDSVVLEHGAATAAIGLDIDAASLSMQGEVLLHAPALTVKVEERTMSGDLLARLVAKRVGDRTDLATSKLAFNEARASGTHQEPWFAHATMNRASLTIKPSTRLAAQFTGAARDSSPGGFLVHAMTSLPPAPGSASNGGRVDFGGGVVVTHTLLSLHDFVATCGAASVRVTYCRDKGGSVGSAIVGVAGGHVTVDLAEPSEGRGGATPQSSECARSHSSPASTL